MWAVTNGVWLMVVMVFQLTVKVEYNLLSATVLVSFAQYNFITLLNCIIVLLKLSHFPSPLNTSWLYRCFVGGFFFQNVPKLGIKIEKFVWLWEYQNYSQFRFSNSDSQHYKARTPLDPWWCSLSWGGRALKSLLCSSNHCWTIFALWPGLIVLLDEASAIRKYCSGGDSS